MDRTVVKKTTLEEQDEAFCLSLSPNDRLRVLEELNRQGRIPGRPFGIVAYESKGCPSRRIRTIMTTKSYQQFSAMGTPLKNGALHSTPTPITYT